MVGGVAATACTPGSIHQAKRRHHRPWCGSDIRALGWGIIGAQAMVWAKAADQHGEQTARNIAATEVGKNGDIFVAVWFIST